jgi:hypothetical protein
VPADLLSSAPIVTGVNSIFRSLCRGAALACRQIAGSGCPRLAVVPLNAAVI